MGRKQHGRRSFWRFGLAGVTFGALAIGWDNIGFAQPLKPGTPLGGAPDFILEFDEAGHGRVITGVGAGAVAVAVDQTGVPQLGGGIAYSLPVPVVPGDVVINSLELSEASRDNPSGFSDLLTFSNLENQGVLLYRSLQDENEPTPDPADVLGLLPADTAFSTFETGPEGNNSFAWLGDVNGTSSTVYNGISDIPEPSTFVLLGLALAGFLGHRLRKRFV